MTIPLEQSFWDHLEELRQVILRCLAVILLGFAIALSQYDHLIGYLVPQAPELKEIRQETVRIQNSGSQPAFYELLQGERLLAPLEGVQLKNSGVHIQPGEQILLERSLPSRQLVLLTPTEGLSTVIKIAFWVGLVVTAPIWLFLLLRFAAPALERQERWLIFPFILCSLLFLAAGIAFAQSLTLPLANRVLYDFNAGLGHNLWSLHYYLQYTLIVLLGNGLAFECGVILLFLVHFGRIGPEGMRKRRRHVILGIFVAAAILTPPDVLTQCMLALPLWGFYEGSLLYAIWRQKRTSGFARRQDPDHPDPASAAATARPDQ